MARATVIGCTRQDLILQPTKPLKDTQQNVTDILPKCLSHICKEHCKTDRALLCHMASEKIMRSSNVTQKYPLPPRAGREGTRSGYCEPASCGMQAVQMG